MEQILLRCFRSVFPGWDDERILHAEKDSQEAWDSLASVMLLAVIQQESGVETDVSLMDRWTSFQGILEDLQKGVGAHRTPD